MKGWVSERLKGKSPGVAVNAAGAFTKEKRAGFRVTVL